MTALLRCAIGVFSGILLALLFLLAVILSRGLAGTFIYSGF